MYHDRQAAVIVEFSHFYLAQQALTNINTTCPNLNVELIKDMRTILNRSRSSPEHTPRYSEQPLNTNNHTQAQDQFMTLRDYPDYTYRLRHVPLNLAHEDI